MGKVAVPTPHTKCNTKVLINKTSQPFFCPNAYVHVYFARIISYDTLLMEYTYTFVLHLFLLLKP